SPQQQMQQPQQEPNGGGQSFNNMPRKNMFEGGNSAQPMINTTGMNFRTHDEAPAQVAYQPQQAQYQQAAAPQSESPNQAPAYQAPAAAQASARTAVAPASAEAQDNGPNLSDALSKVTDAEAQKDYNSAISICRDILANSLQNAEVHHRLAVNL